MSQMKAILLGAFLVVLGALLAQGLPDARAAVSGSGPYMLMQHSNTTSNVGVFRLDTTSGAVSYCYMLSNSLKCTAEVE